MDAGAFGVVALAVAVGGLTLSSITSSIGGGSASKAPAEVKQLLDRVPEPLPVAKRAQQAATQVSSKGDHHQGSSGCLCRDLLCK